MKDEIQCRSIALTMTAIAGVCSGGRDVLGALDGLVRTTGLSRSTVCRAIARLKALGIVEGGRGRSVRVVDAGRLAALAHDVVPELKQSVRESVAVRIVEDIRAGHSGLVHDGMTVKELCARYHVSYRTMRSVLAQVCGRYLLRREGLRYKVPSVRSTRASLRVVLIARGESQDDRGQLSLLYERTQVMHRQLEHTCREMGLALEVLPFYYVNDTIELPSRLLHLVRDQRALRGIAGYVLWTLTGQAPVLRELAGRQLRATGKPVAVFDDEDKLLPRQMAREADGRLLFFSLPDQREAGREVGRYLLSRGHRRVAFISRYRNEYWAQQRYEGLRDTIGTGSGGRLDWIDPGLAHPNQLLGPLTGTHLQLWVDAARDAVERSSGRLLALGREAQSRMEARLGLARRLFEVLPVVAARGEHSAWVGANDEVALACMDMLDSCPAGQVRPLLVGFDSSAESGAFGLTSYSFNEEALVSSMVRYLLDPRATCRLNARNSVFSVPGRLVERQTSFT